MQGTEGLLAVGTGMQRDGVLSLAVQLDCSLVRINFTWVAGDSETPQNTKPKNCKPKKNIADKSYQQ
jgi:hypothetical protein